MKINHSKEFYENLLKAIDHILKNDVTRISFDEGSDRFGDYWTAIVDVLVDNYVGTRSRNHGFNLTQLERILPIREDCLAAIDEIRKSEYDRDLANKESISNIQYGKKGYELAKKSSKWAKASIIISAVLAIGQVLQWLLMLLQHLRQS